MDGGRGEVMPLELAMKRELAYRKKVDRLLLQLHGGVSRENPMLISEQAQSYNQLAMSCINKPCRQLTMVVVSVMSHSFLMTKIYSTTQLLLLQ
ncbi:unnamed protein product, partial [Vitis vinifera]|uniref:Uncharacterized protein n=1 Tax=Vitis vinifera TaxID=29760 RepID=D7SI62_VITVI